MKPSLAQILATSLPDQALALPVPLALPVQPNSLSNLLTGLAAAQHFELDIRLEASSTALIGETGRASDLATISPAHVFAREIASGELTVTVGAGQLVAFTGFLKHDPECRFTSLVDITAVDHPERVARFEVVYHFLSMYRNARIRVKLAVAEDEMVPSIHELHP